MVFSPRFPDKYRAIGRALVDSYHRVLTRPYFASGTDPAWEKISLRDTKEARSFGDTGVAHTQPGSDPVKKPLETALHHLCLQRITASR
jgi:hypothetical protein